MINCSDVSEERIASNMRVREVVWVYVEVIKVKVKVKVRSDLEQTMKAQKRSRGIALLFL